MALTDRQRLALATVAVVGVVAGLAVWNQRRHDDLAGARPLDLPDAPAIWAATARCLSDDAPYPSGVRFYVGDTIPSSWVYLADEGKTFGGYAGTGERIIFRSAHPAPGLVAHEVWHLAHSASHPVAVFGDATKGLPPRCGLARP